VRGFEQGDSGFQAGRLLALLSDHAFVASLFPAAGINLCAQLLKGDEDIWGSGGCGRVDGGGLQAWEEEEEAAAAAAVEAVGSGEFQANVLRVLARVCRQNAQASLRVSKMPWLPEVCLLVCTPYMYSLYVLLICCLRYASTFVVSVPRI